MNCRTVMCLLVLGCVVATCDRVLADTFGSGAETFEIEFVPIGSQGNPPYSVANPAGAVDYRYRIAKYEISEQMIDKANALGLLGITHDGRGSNKPVTSVTWYEAARFVNWLNLDAGYPAAYKFISGNFVLWDPNDPGYNPDNLFRNKLAKYVLPSLDEWHKAAYYDGDAGVWHDYPTGSNSVPDGIDSPGDPDFDAVFFDGGSNPQPNDVTNVGLLSPFGTLGQGGNVDEWEETEFDRQNDSPSSDRAFRGGGWKSTASRLFAPNRGDALPNFQADALGFRVVSIPEPSSIALVSLAIAIVRHFVRPMHRKWLLPIGASLQQLSMGHKKPLRHV